MVDIAIVDRLIRQLTARGHHFFRNLYLHIKLQLILPGAKLVMSRMKYCQMVLPFKFRAIVSSSSASSLVFCWNIPYHQPSAALTHYRQVRWVYTSRRDNYCIKNNISSICQLLFLCVQYPTIETDTNLVHGWIFIGSWTEHVQETEVFTDCQLACQPGMAPRPNGNGDNEGPYETSSFTSTHYSSFHSPLLTIQKTCVVTYHLWTHMSDQHAHYD